MGLKCVAIAVAGAVLVVLGGCQADLPMLTVEWDKNVLTIRGEHLPGGEVKVWYLEAYCRANSHTTDWGHHTVIGHRTERVFADDHGKRIDLRCKLTDGVVVDHRITAAGGVVNFRVVARNPTDRASQAHWAQPCIRVGTFTGSGPDDTDDKYRYVPKCFVFLDGKLERMPTRDWATQARYTPGQVWAAPGVSGDDVNPRPLNPHTPSNGLIGCFSADDKLILATAWQPYQELFQGVIRCIHSDFRIGGLAPGQTKTISGKIYIVPNDLPALLRRYAEEFPEQKRESSKLKANSHRKRPAETETPVSRPGTMPTVRPPAPPG